MYRIVGSVLVPNNRGRMEGEEFDNKQEKENTTRIVQINMVIKINISIIIIQLQLQLHKREDDSELRDIRI